MFESSDSDLDNFRGEKSALNEYKAPEKTAPKRKRASRRIIDKNLTSVLDRAKISDGSAAMVLAPIIKKLVKIQPNLL